MLPVGYHEGLRFLLECLYLNTVWYFWKISNIKVLLASWWCDNDLWILICFQTYYIFTYHIHIWHIFKFTMDSTEHILITSQGAYRYKVLWLYSRHFRHTQTIRVICNTDLSWMTIHVYFIEHLWFVDRAGHFDSRMGVHWQKKTPTNTLHLIFIGLKLFFKEHGTIYLLSVIYILQAAWCAGHCLGGTANEQKLGKTSERVLNIGRT